MIFAELPPVGDVIEKGDVSRQLPCYSGYQAVWLESGTAALALAMLHARQAHPDVTHPEVVLPAYGCPDLVAAAVFAGLQPVLVDIAGNHPGYALDSLRDAVDSNTVAVVVVNFLGLADRLADIRALLPSAIALIEDNAQWQPEVGSPLAGDYVVRSFGRGKPASALGGGLLLARHGLAPLQPLLQEVVEAEGVPSALESLRFGVKVQAYHLLRQPCCYYWVNRNPFIKLGETRLKTLGGIRAMPAYLRSRISSSVERHLAGDRWREERYHQIFAELPGLHSLAKKSRERSGRLLRYPVLCDSRLQRDQLLSQLNAEGLGASALYRYPLRKIPGVAALARLRGDDSQAFWFADRLLTLPLHDQVQATHIERIGTVCRTFADQNPQNIAFDKLA